MGLSSTIEPLRGANLVSGVELYAWEFFSIGGGRIASSGKVEIQTKPLGDLPAYGPSMVIACAGVNVERYLDRRISAHLNAAYRHGVPIGSVSTGVYMIAEAGLLNGQTCSVHWNARDAFKRRYPNIEINDALFTIDSKILTSAGGTAALDMMLHVMAQHHGPLLTNVVSDQFIHGPMRMPTTQQRMEIQQRINIRDRFVAGAVAMMEANCEMPLATDEIAGRLGISLRRLERRFRSSLGVSPIRYYGHLRLQRAQRLLDQTDLTIVEIASACGYQSASHFSRVYRAAFGKTPSAHRRRAPVP